MIYAIISDIHGNSLAFEAVLKDIRARGIEEIINLGDYFFGALEPEKVAVMMRENKMLCISGNTDREIIQAVDGDFDKEGMARVKQERGPGLTGSSLPQHGIVRRPVRDFPQPARRCRS